MGQLFAITPFTLLDFPGEMACIAWMSGCNMRCLFCHNPDIVTGKGGKEDSELLDFLQTRKGKLTAVVFSGGEPTLYAGLSGLVSCVRDMGFRVKLDTNGSRPEILRHLLAEGLLHYVAMDYKCPPSKAEKITGTAKHWQSFRESLGLMIEASKEKTGFEVRTTVHADLMDEDDLNWIIDDLDALGYQGTYYIQNIAATGEKTLCNIEKPSRKLDPSLLKTPRKFRIGFRNF